MIFLNELNDLKLYSKQAVFFDRKDKRHGSAIFLLTPNIESSIKVMNSKLLYNFGGYYNSYYIEKDLTIFLSQSTKELVRESLVLEKSKDDHFNSFKSVVRSIKIRTRRGINRSKRTTREVEDISDPKVINPEPDAIEKKRKEDDEERLDVPTLDITIPTPDTTPKSIHTTNEEFEFVAECSDYTQRNIFNDDSSNVNFITEDGNKGTIIIDEGAIEDSAIRKALYKERLRNYREVIPIYSTIKNADMINTRIKYTYTTLDRYKGKNVYIDLFYYNYTYFKNTMYTAEKGKRVYKELMTRLINNINIEQNEYKNKLVVIPISDWSTNPNTKAWKYKSEITPISIIYQLLKEGDKDTFKDTTFLFLGSNNYFKLNMNNFDSNKLGLFRTLIDRVKAKEIVNDIDTDSPKILAAKTIDKIERGTKVTINNLTGSKEETDKEEIEKKKKEGITAKDKLVDNINDQSKNSSSEEDMMTKLDYDDYIKNIIINMDSDNISNNISPSRQKRMDELNSSLLTKSMKEKPIKELLNKNLEETLPTTELKLDTINDDWNELKFMNFDKDYDIDRDIINMLYVLRKKTYPISIRDFKTENTSTSEDRIFTYIVEMEDSFGKRFTIKFDIPIFEDGFMFLRGNRKTISNQLTLKPISETGEDTVQIVSNYNKIFVERYGSVAGKSCPSANYLYKLLSKEGIEKYIKITYGDCSSICSKYNLPIDYIDLASTFSKLEFTYKATEDSNSIGQCTIFFNQNEIRKLYDKYIDESIGIPYGIITAKNKSTPTILYLESNTPNPISTQIIWHINNIQNYRPEFKDLLNSVKISNTGYYYSRASILSTDIPVILICAYSEGLTKVLEKANIAYKIVEKKEKAYGNIPTNDYIKFKDGYIQYRITPTSSMLMNGLKSCPTDMYSLTEINEKSMYVDFLDLYGGRIKADGLDNFYDLMIDPITSDVLRHYNLPTDYVEILIYASNLLVNNNYNTHTSMEGRRLRRKEVLAGYFYKALSDAYKDYSLQIKHGRTNVPLFIKQSAVIDKIMLDPTSQDTSLVSALSDVEYNYSVSTKGLVGMNSDRSYSLDKRTYDDTMQNVIAMATGFAANVGITRQLTIDANVDTARGYIQVDDSNNLSTAKTYCFTEAMTPYGVTMDDPFRSAMTFIQTSKHNVRVKDASPMLITNGADEALPYMVSDVFAFKAKLNGVVEEITDEYMIVKYDGSGKYDYIDLSNNIEKNSANGSYVSIKLDTEYKVGKKFKQGDILAYDKSSFSRDVGLHNNLAFSGTVLAKCALMNTEEGYEDSAIVSEQLAEKLTTNIVTKKETYVDKTSNVYNIVEIGQEVQEGDTLMTIQTGYEEEDVNNLMTSLIDDEDVISELGRINITSKVTGTVQDIKVYRTVEKEELSDTLRKFVNKIEKKSTNKMKVMDKYKIDKKYILDPNYKLEPNGRLKSCEEGVLIVFFLSVDVKFATGDKLVYYSANKGVDREIFEKGKEPYSEFRPDEEISSLVSVGSQQGRMVTSILEVGGIYKTLIELERQIKDDLGLDFEL